jgi:chromosome partitioning protein
MTHLICIANSKGGVLKTTTAATLGHKLALMDANVLLIDADPQGNLATVLGLEPGPDFANAILDKHYAIQDARGQTLALLRGDSSTKTAANEITIRLNDGARDAKSCVSTYVNRLKVIGTLMTAAQAITDYVIVDTPPSGILQELAILAADTIVVPVVLDYLAMGALAGTMAMIPTLNKQGAQIIIVPTMFQRNRERNYNLNLLNETYPGAVTMPVPYCTAARDAAAQGQTIWEIRHYGSLTLSAMRQAYEQLADWINRPIDDLLFGEVQSDE